MENNDKKIQSFVFLKFSLDLMSRETKQETELTNYYIGWNNQFWTNLIPTDDTNTKFVFFKAGYYALYDARENKAQELTRTAYLNLKDKKEVRVSSDPKGKNTNLPKSASVSESRRPRKGFEVYYREIVGGKRK